MKRTLSTLSLAGISAVVASLVACVAAPAPTSEPTTNPRRTTPALSVVVEQTDPTPRAETGGASPAAPTTQPQAASPEASPSPRPPATASAAATATAGPSAPVTGTVGDVRLMIPTVMKVAPARSTAYGVGITPVNQEGGLDLITSAGATWTRRFMNWGDVEPTEGARNWGQVASLEAELRDAARAGVEVLLIVGGTPSWAQLSAGVKCGPVKPDKLDAFANFARDLATRYTAAEFNVTHFEMWNEPDVALGAVAPDSEFGCWGQPGDAYFGGGHYADMLKALYPKVKQANPKAQVVVGGLLLDCNPDSPPAGKDCSSARFFEGILRNGGGSAFDGVSFHAYDFAGIAGWYGNPGWGTAWNTTGPVGTVKAHYLKSLMQTYGVAGKYLKNTEVALLCWECPTVPPIFEDIKADYLAQSYAAAIADGLKANLWYNLYGWFWSGLITGEAREPLPAYRAFGVSKRVLEYAQPTGVITSADVGDPAVAGYKFNRPSGDVWVVWSKDNQPKTLTLTTAPTTVYDALGTPRSAGASVGMTTTVLYLEFGQTR